MSFTPVGLFPINPVTTRGVSTKLSASKDKILYTNGKTVIIRDLNGSAPAITYSGHVQTTTVARLSPSGYYCASADISGTVRVWDTVGTDQTLKGEYKVISGRINDVAWDGESKRIAAVGDGRDKSGHAFMFDSGSSTGEIGGHSKAINAVSIRHQRPFRAATAGDDGLIVFHSGVPFKFEKTIKTHTKFVQDVRYSTSGDHFASVGSDSKVFIYDGKTGDTVKEFTQDSHTGSIMACTWSPDDTKLVTSAADCTVKLWDVSTGKAVSTWKLGSGVNHQQVGNLWSGVGDIVSLSISGDLNIFDERVGDKPARIVEGPTKSVTAAALSSSSTFLTGTADGRILSYDIPTGSAHLISGDGHTNFIAGLASTTDGKVFSAGYDDRVREIEGPGFSAASVSTGAQPKAIAASEDSLVFVAEADGKIEVIKSNQKVGALKAPATPTSIAASKTLVAIGGEDQKVYLMQWNGKSLKPVVTLEENKGPVTALAFSPDGTHLAAGDTSGRVSLYSVTEKKLITSRWSFHSARINSLSWTSDGQHCASGSLDTHVYIWSVAKPMKNIAIKNANPGGANAVLWVGEKKLMSTGHDGCSRLWEVTFHV